MSTKKKGGTKMTTLKLKELESNVKSNYAKRRQIIDNFEAKTMRSNMQKGRVRPKHPTEVKILSMFSRK